MTGLGDQILWPLLRATLLLAVSAVLVQGLIWWLRPTSPRIQRAGWFLVLLQGVVLFHLPVRLTWLESRPPQPPASMAESHIGMSDEAPPDVALPPPSLPVEPPATQVPAVDVSRPTPPPEPAESLPWASLAATVWLSGVVCLPLWAALAYVRFLWRLRSARPALESWLREWQTLLAAEAIRRAIPLAVTDHIGPAMCWTPRGYRVFVPERLWAELSVSQRAAVLRHELAHLRRGDLWLTLVARLLALPHWFNPFAWWAVHRFAECAEWACDQSAAGPHRAAATDYAKALLCLGTTGVRSASCATTVRGGSLFVRIRRLTSARFSEDSLMKKATIVLVAAGLVAAGAVRVELVAQEPGQGGAGEAGPVQPAATRSGAAAEPVPLRTDLYGDPLPPGAIARLGTLRLHSPHGFDSVAFLPDGKTLATAHRDESVLRFWDLQTGKQVRAYRAEWPQAVAFSPDGTKVATLGHDRKRYIVTLLDAASGRQLFRHTEEVTAEMLLHGGVAFRPDGKGFAAAYFFGTVRVWDVTGRPEFSWSAGAGSRIQFNCVAFSPDGKTLAAADPGGSMPEVGNRIVAGDKEASDLARVRLWNLEKGGEPLRIDLPRWHSVRSLVFAPDGNSLIGGVRQRVSVPDPRNTPSRIFAGGGDSLLLPGVRVWDVSTGRLLREVVTGKTEYRSSRGEIPLSKDGRMFAFPCRGGIHVWDAANRREMHTSHSAEARKYESVAFSPDGTALAATADRAIYVWRIATGKPWLQPLLPEYSEAENNLPQSLANPLPGNLVPTLRSPGQFYQSVRLSDAATGKEAARLLLPVDNSDILLAFAFSPDGRTAAACVGYEPTARRYEMILWEITTGRTLYRAGLPEPATFIAYSSDGQRLAVATIDGRPPAARSVIHVFDTAGKEVARLPEDVPAEMVVAIGFSADDRGSTLVSLGLGRRWFVRSWNLSTRKPRSSFEIPVEPEEGGPSGAFSPDGKQFAFSQIYGREVTVWDVQTGKSVGRLEVGPYALAFTAFSPDGLILAVACDEPFVDAAVRRLPRDKLSEEQAKAAAQRRSRIDLWDLRSNQRLGSFGAGSAWVHGVAFTSDGKRLITGLYDQPALVWDVPAAAGKSGP